MTPPRTRVLVAAAACVVALASSACTGAGGATTEPPASGSIDPGSFAAEVATSDLYIGAPQAVQVGVYASTADQGVQLMTFGTLAVTFAPYEGGGGTPVESQAHYVPAPGTAAERSDPVLSVPSTARGVYEADDVAFDRSGVWEATVTFSLDGDGPFAIHSTPFNVAESPSYPAPGDRALPTKNLTMSSDVPPEAIDSRAADGGKVPDSELHQHTIAGSLRQHHPILVVFATPVYCQSQFCGPVTDAVQQLADEYPTKADFIHIEIWKQNPTVINQAAADWLYRHGDLTEPWLYLIDAHGMIVDRWGPLFDMKEVARLLAALPDMKG